jgi:hypothetical protein
VQHVRGHGGRREGAGRPAGSGWIPAVSAMREETIQRMKSIVCSDRDPLSVVVDMVLDEELDVSTRLGAASIALPFLYPKLSATTVDARTTVVKIDGNALIEKLNARLERLIEAPQPLQSPHQDAVVIESVATDPAEAA